MSESRTHSIRVLIVDDHAVVRRGLRFFLETEEEIQIVGEAEDGEAAVAEAGRLAPDVVVMDLVMPGMDGVQATRRILEERPRTKVIVLTSFSEQDRVVPAIKAGAAGYLLKDVSPEHLIEAIRAVHRGEARLHPAVARTLMLQVGKEPSPFDEGRPVETLTPRERDVLRLITHGKSNKEIAAALSITETTVKSHVSNLLGKLGLDDRTQAAVYALKHGLAGDE